MKMRKKQKNKETKKRPVSTTGSGRGIISMDRKTPIPPPVGGHPHSGQYMFVFSLNSWQSLSF